MQSSCKIDRFVNADSDMGIVYERSIGNESFSLTSKRSMMLFPRGGCRVKVVESPKTQHVVTATMLLYIRPGSNVKVQCQSAILDLLVLMPCQTYQSELLTDNKLGSEEAKVLESKNNLIRRSRWLDDLIDRYFFERVVNADTPPGCPFFLEKQMLNELARLIFKGKVPTTGEVLGEEPSDLALKALKYIEENLFNKFELDDLCKHTNVSQPTLTRAFKKMFGKTPGNYVKERRLDEASAMIERDEHRIGDICTLIGYEDLGSFSRAFKERFLKSPSEYREFYKSK